MPQAPVTIMFFLQAPSDDAVLQNSLILCNQSSDLGIPSYGFPRPFMGFLPKEQGETAGLQEQQRKSRPPTTALPLLRGAQSNRPGRQGAGRAAFAETPITSCTCGLWRYSATPWRSQSQAHAACFCGGSHTCKLAASSHKRRKSKTSHSSTEIMSL